MLFPPYHLLSGRRFQTTSGNIVWASGTLVLVMPSGGPAPPSALAGPCPVPQMAFQVLTHSRLGGRGWTACSWLSLFHRLKTFYLCFMWICL